jgi:hypothetical protein
MRNILQVFFVLWTICPFTCNSLFQYITPPPVESEDGSISLLSSDFGYPDNEEAVDVIWAFSHSIALETVSFGLDGQKGDFLLISDLPLLYGEYLRNETVLPEDLHELIVSDSMTLMSWAANETKVHVLSQHGTFVLFHAEPKSPSNGVAFSEGFNITVRNLGTKQTIL